MNIRSKIFQKTVVEIAFQSIKRQIQWETNKTNAVEGDSLKTGIGAEQGFNTYCGR